MLNLVKKSEIIFHFNKKYLEDNTIPMWVIKTKGETYYVHHVNVDAGVGFSTKQTPTNEHTKGSIKIKGRIKIENVDDLIIANIY